jgi:hypothetical protein
MRDDQGRFIDVADIEVKEELLRALPCYAYMFVARMD